MELDPRDHCDRVGEQAIFAELMEFKSARLLTISDVGRSGKSSLLLRFQHNCYEEFKPSVPSSLVELNLLGQTEESALAQTTYHFARSVIRAFKHRVDKPRTLFSSFYEKEDALNRALEAASETPVQGTASTEFNKGQNIGVNYEIHSAGGTVNIQNGRAGLTPDQVQRFQEQCIEAFFADLRATSAQRPLAILLDGWERCNRDLQGWIREEFLGKNVFPPDHARRPSQLLVVIAGRPHGYNIKGGEHTRGLRPDEFRGLFDSAAELEHAIQHIAGLGREWDDDTIQRFVRILGYPPLDAVELNFIREKMHVNGWPPGRIKTAVQSWYEESEAS